MPIRWQGYMAIVQGTLNFECTLHNLHLTLPAYWHLFSFSYCRKYCRYTQALTDILHNRWNSGGTTADLPNYQQSTGAIKKGEDYARCSVVDERENLLRNPTLALLCLRCSRTVRRTVNIRNIYFSVEIMAAVIA